MKEFNKKYNIQKLSMVTVEHIRYCAHRRQFGVGFLLLCSSRVESVGVGSVGMELKNKSSRERLSGWQRDDGICFHLVILSFHFVYV